MKQVPRAVFLIILICIPACADSEPDSASSEVSESAIAVTEGMYLPVAATLPQAELEQVGITIPPREIQEIATGAVAHLGGFCSSTFMSDQGIIGTNYHCAQGCVAGIVRRTINDESKGSDHPHAKIAETGFIAEDFEEEISCSGHFVKVLSDITNVSSQFSDLMNAEDMDPFDKAEAIRRREETIREECRGGREDIVCDVSFMNNDPEPFYLYTFKKINDVRLVWAPPLVLGQFGGNTDNWEYPRHTADFSFLRVYDEDGTPYKPTHFAKASKQGIAPDDAQFILGFPGSTQRNITSHAAQFLQTVIFPYGHEYLKTFTDVIEERYGANPKDSPYGRAWDRMENYVENYDRKWRMMEAADVVAVKAQRETILKDDDGFTRIATIYGDADRYYRKLSLLGRMTTRSSASVSLGAASYVWQWITQPPENIDREDERFKTWNEPQLRSFLETADNFMTYEDEKVMLATFFEMSGRLNTPIRALEDLRQKQGDSLSMAEAVLSGTKIVARQDTADERARASKLRMEMLEMTPEEVEATGDTLILLAKALVEERLAMRKDPAVAQPYVYELPYLNHALNVQMRYKAPDANSTLRASFSTVQHDYKPIDEEDVTHPFATTLTSMVERGHSIGEEHPEHSLFSVPDAIEEAQKAKGSYSEWFFYDGALQDVPVNFITRHVLTGGSSGSAAYNNDGEVVGFAFDGTPESILSDVWLHDQSRAILVDIRFVGFLGNVIYPEARRVLEEVGLPTTAELMAQGD